MGTVDQKWKGGGGSREKVGDTCGRHGPRHLPGDKLPPPSPVPSVSTWGVRAEDVGKAKETLSNQGS